MTAENNTPGSYRILFVCTGNTCRSPLAEALARRAVEARGWTHVEVMSAGLATGGGSPASGGAARAAERHGLDLSGHRSRAATSEMLASADLVLAMTPSHLAIAAGAGAADRAHLLGAFAAGPDGTQAAAVPDPFGGSDAEYEETFNLLEELVEAALGRITPPARP